MRDLTVLIPCYNEEHRLPETLKVLSDWHSLVGNHDVQFVFVNDGSLDRTSDILSKMSFPGSVVHIDKNQGKGGAIAVGLEVVKTKWVLVMDADLSTSLDCIDVFFTKAQNENYDLVLGDRFHPLSLVKRSPIRKLSSYVFFFIIHAGGDFSMFDTQCGFKLFKTTAAQELFKNLRLKRYSFDLEILYCAIPLFKIYSHPIKWTEKPGSGVRLFKDGLQMVYDFLLLKSRK